MQLPAGIRVALGQIEEYTKHIRGNTNEVKQSTSNMRWEIAELRTGGNAKDSGAVSSQLTNSRPIFVLSPDAFSLDELVAYIEDSEVQNPGWLVVLRWIETKIESRIACSRYQETVEIHFFGLRVFILCFFKQVV